MTRVPRQPTKTRRAKSAAIVVIVALAAVAMAAAFSVYSVLYRPATTVEPGRPIQLAVPKGASTARIATLLAEAGVVRNANMFRLKARDAGVDGGLRAGVYDLATGMPYELAIETLKQGPPVSYVTVTIPEGWSARQIAMRLDEQAGIPKREFLELATSGADEFAAEHPYLKDAYKNSLEGYLFPKTYRLKEGTTAREAIEVMLDQFDKEVLEVDLDRAAKKGLSVPEVVTIASIIEREARIAKERPLVSSVIYNRLDKDMRLQMCSTVVYVLQRNSLRLTVKETRTPSPYNTYLHEGLPPGPISNPGLASLKAAAAPADTDFIYYVLTGKDGSQTYASNAADFAKAKQKSKEVFGE